MINDINNLDNLIKIINDSNLDKDFMLIGSWCEYFYQEYFDNYRSQMKTTDFDFYIKNKHISSEKINISSSFAKYGFERFDDYMTEKTVFKKDDNIVEFLTGIDRNKKDIYSIEKLGIKAESLTRLDIFDKNHLDAEYKGMNIKIPSPAAYVIHKLIINNDRKNEKSKKDLISIKGLLLRIKQSPDDFKNLEIIYKSDIVGRKGRNKIDVICQNNNIKLFEAYSFKEELQFRKMIEPFNDSQNVKSEENDITKRHFKDHDDYEI